MLKNIKIGTRLGLAFSALMILFVCVSGLGMWRLQIIGDITNQMVNIALKKERLLADWHGSTQLNGGRTLRVMVEKNVEKRNVLEAEIKNTSKHISDVETELDKLQKNAFEKKAYDALAVAREGYKNARADYFDALNDKTKKVNRDAAEKKIEASLQSYLFAIKKLGAIQDDLITKISGEVQAQSQLGQRDMAVLTCVAMLIGIVFSIMITRSITGPIRRAVAVANQVSEGDLSAEIVVDRHDEAGDLLLALHNMNVNLSGIVRSVRAGAELVATATTEIAIGNTELSSRTEEQAASLEETASSMEEFTGTVQQNSENSIRAYKLASETSLLAEKSGQIMDQVVTTMAKIDHSSKRIVDIVATIDGIAFQTNILALNAAVEAARAGDAGRGFAVVASEVRELSHRSALAAKEIRSLIQASKEDIENGTVLVGLAGKSSAELAEGITWVASIMSDISDASKDQASGIEQVNSAISQMDSVTQQNAALVEEAAASAMALREQAHELTRTVSHFRGIKADSGDA